MFLYFCCPVQWISSVFPLTTDVSAPIRSSRFITYLLTSSLPLVSLPSPSSPPWSSEPGSAAFYALRRHYDDTVQNDDTVHEKDNKGPNRNARKVDSRKVD